MAFSSEEKWILSLVQGTEDDKHPDAHACRIRIAQIIEDCDETPEWNVEADKKAYFKKIERVSLVCRLTKEEERNLGAENGFTKNREKYLEILQRGQFPQTMNFAGSPASCAGGIPHKMFQEIPKILDSVKKSLRIFLKYTKPGSAAPGSVPTIQGAALVNLIDEMFEDDLGGSKKGMSAFLLLYQALSGFLNLEFFPSQQKGDKKEEVTVCEAVQKESKKQDSKEEKQYSCPKCTVFNDVTNLKCSVCAAPNPARSKPSFDPSSEGPRNPCRNVPLLKLLINAWYLKVTKMGEKSLEIPHIHLALLQPFLHSVVAGADSTQLPVFPHSRVRDKLNEGLQSSSDQLVQDFVDCLLKSASDICTADFNKVSLIQPQAIPSVAIIMDGQFRCRPLTTDCSRNQQQLKSLDGQRELNAANLGLSDEDLIAFRNAPLQGLVFGDFMEKEQTETILSEQLPFDLSSVDEARSIVAESMQNRMNTDMKKSSIQLPRMRLKCLSPANMSSLMEEVKLVESKISDAPERSANRTIPHLLRRVSSVRDAVNSNGARILVNAFTVLSPLKDKLQKFCDLDLKQLSEGNSELLKFFNRLDEKEANPSRIVHELLRFAKARVTVWWEAAAAAYISSAQEDLQALNPFLSDLQYENISLAVTGLLLRTIRLAQSNQCLIEVGKLISHIKAMFVSRVEVEIQNWNYEFHPSNALIRHVVEENLVRHVVEKTFEDSEIYSCLKDHLDFMENMLAVLVSHVFCLFFGLFLLVLLLVIACEVDFIFCIRLSLIIKTQNTQRGKMR
jgi:hypothetical protein